MRISHNQWFSSLVFMNYIQYILRISLCWYNYTLPTINFIYHIVYRNQTIFFNNLCYNQLNLFEIWFYTIMLNLWFSDLIVFFFYCCFIFFNFHNFYLYIIHSISSSIAINLSFSKVRSTNEVNFSLISILHN